jgi:SAM-dependent methyltransferase
MWPAVTPTSVYRDYVEYVSDTLPHYTVLDLGCGKGRHVKLFAAGTSNIVVGIDFMPDSLFAGKTLNKLYKFSNIKLINADLWAMPFKSKFDLIIDSGLFHHIRVSDWKKYINLILSHLGTNNKSAFYILSVFGKNYTLYTKKQLNRNWSIFDARYDHYFSHKDIEIIFAPHFNIISSDVEGGREGKELLHFLMEKKKNG